MRKMSNQTKLKISGMEKHYCFSHLFSTVNFLSMIQIKKISVFEVEWPSFVQPDAWIRTKRKERTQ